VYVATVQTEFGERKRVALPDGSVLDLNTQSRVAVKFFRDRRTVALESGEAMFSVEHDAGKPFLVHAGERSIRVTGTRFNVRRDGDGASVFVLSGHVEISALPGTVLAQLSAGDALGAGATAPHRADVAALTAWRDGRLVFDDVPLAEVVREVSRYRRLPIRIDGEGIAGMRMSSTFSLNDTDALLAALPRILPVAVRRLPDGSAEIVHP
jgi:transmembrane sensor